MATEWNEDGEQYPVVLMGEHAATFTDVEDAADFYDDHACQFCWTHKRMHDDRCCDVQTWTRS
jgi:hypothetical protein